MRSVVTHAFVGGVALVIGLALASVLGGGSTPEPERQRQRQRQREQESAEATDPRSPTIESSESTERRPEGLRRTTAAGTRPDVDGPSTAPEAPDLGALGEPLTAKEITYLREALAEKRLRDEGIAAEAEEMARRLASMSSLDGLTVLDSYLRGAIEGSDAIDSFGAMRARIRPQQEPVHRLTATAERTTVDLSAIGDDRRVIEFGPGTFVLNRGNSRWNIRDERIPSLEIRGAGMDRTTLIGPGWAFLCTEKHGAIENLVVRDLTIDAGTDEQMFLSVRGGMSVALDRVRVKDWPVAGICAAIGVSGKAFVAARDCAFEGDGYALGLRGPAVAVFERCRFTGQRSALSAHGHRRGPPARVRFDDCTFGAVKLTVRGGRRTPDEGGAVIEIHGGTAHAGPKQWTRAKRVEEFGATGVATMDGFRFVDAAATFSGDDLVTALAAAESAGLRNVIGLAVARPGSVPVELDVYALADEPGDPPVCRTRLYEDGRLSRPGEDPRRGVTLRRVPSRDSVLRVRSLAELARGLDLGRSVEITRAELQTIGTRSIDGERSEMVVFQVTLRGGTTVAVDADTGAELSRGRGR